MLLDWRRLAEAKAEGKKQPPAQVARRQPLGQEEGALHAAAKKKTKHGRDKQTDRKWRPVARRAARHTRVALFWLHAGSAAATKDFSSSMKRPCLWATVDNRTKMTTKRKASFSPSSPRLVLSVAKAAAPFPSRIWARIRAEPKWIERASTEYPLKSRAGLLHTALSSG